MREGIWILKLDGMRNNKSRSARVYIYIKGHKAYGLKNIAM